MATETKSLRERNPFTSIEDEPITKAQVEELLDTLRRYWEDAELVTDPNRYQIGLSVGNLQAICRTLLRGKRVK